jgi:hypothetical protein
VQTVTENATDSPTRKSSSHSLDASLGCIGIGIATASFIHMLSFPWWMSTITGQLLLAATLVLLFFPRSILALCLFLLSSLMFWFQRLPFVPNHIFFEMLIHASMIGTVLAVTACNWKKHLSPVELRAAIYEQMRPVIMGSLIIMYLFTVLHKLNWDFLNPAVSCAVSMHKELAASVPIIPSSEWTQWPTIIGTLLIELAIPIGLWWRRTRVPAVILGLLFHWFLALHPHGGIYSFSHLLYALYAVFLFSSQEDPFRTWQKIPKLGVLAAKLAGVFIFGTACFLQIRAYKNGGNFLTVNAIGFYTWILFATWQVATYAPTLVKMGWQNFPSPTLRPISILWIFLVLVFLNGSCPYLSLKTTTAFSMFSNIRTEGTGNNHLFMPRLKLVQYQDELVEILESNNRQLQQHVKSKDLLTWFEFRRIVSSQKRRNLVVKYKRLNEAEKIFEQKNAAADDDLVTQHPWYLSRFLVFRPVGRLDRPMPCRH